MDNLLAIAFSQYGHKEIAGSKDNPEIVKYFHDLGFMSSDFKDETAWCSAFVNWCAFKSGRPHTGLLNARSWLNIGVPVPDPTIGDIVVFWRDSPDSWQGHVAFYIRQDATHIWCLGGNQGNSVSIAAYPKTQLLGYRKI